MHSTYGHVVAAVLGLLQRHRQGQGQGQGPCQHEHVSCEAELSPACSCADFWVLLDADEAQQVRG